MKKPDSAVAAAPGRISRRKQLADFVEQHQVRVFTRAELATIMNLPDAQVGVALDRFKRAGLVTRLGRGLWGVGRYRIEAAAVKLDPLAYESGASALHRHGLIEQAPAVITWFTTARTGRLALGTVTLSLTRIKPSLYFGFDERTRVACPEKAVLDYLYGCSYTFGSPRRAPGGVLAGIRQGLARGNLTYATLAEMSKPFPRSIRKMVASLAPARPRETMNHG